MASRENSASPSDPDRHFDLHVGGDHAKAVPRLVNLVLLEALRAGAPQVHLHSGTQLIRFLHSGEWVPVMKIPAEAFGPLINRVRVMAGLDRTADNARQEGSFTATAEAEPVTIRAVVQFTDGGDEEAYLHLPSAEPP